MEMDKRERGGRRKMGRDRRERKESRYMSGVGRYRGIGGIEI